MNSSDPLVHYKDVVPCGECTNGCDACDQQGFFYPGWYFWNETWNDLHGPFRNKKQAEDALVEYAKTL
jgi:hypothetical protein